MVSLDLIRNVTIKYAIQGVEAATRGNATVEKSLENIAKQADFAGAAVDRTSRKFTSSANQMASLARSLDSGEAVAQRLARQLAAIDKAVGTGVFAGDDGARALQKVLNDLAVATELAMIKTDKAREANLRFIEANNAEAKAVAAVNAVLAAQQSELDRLTQKFDPVTTAARALNAEIADLNRAYELGVSIAGGYSAAYDRIVSRYEETAKAATKLSDAERAINEARAQQTAADSQEMWNAYAGVSRPSAASNGATVSALMEEEKEVARLQAAYSQLRWEFEPLAAATEQYNAQLAAYQAMAAKGILTTDQLAAATSTAAAKFDAVSAQIAAAGRSGQITSGQLVGMQYQLNDIAVSLSSGQSPFVVLMQQGMQITQMFGPGTTLANAGKTIAAGMTAFLNPLNLVVVGIAAAAGAATLAFQKVGGELDKTNEVLTRHSDLIERIAKAYDDAAISAAKMVEASRREAQVLARGGYAESQVAARASAADVLEQIGSERNLRFARPGQSLFAIDSSYRSFSKPIEDFFTSVKAGTPDVEKLVNGIVGLAQADPTNEELQKTARSLIDMVKPLRDLTAQAEAFQTAIDRADPEGAIVWDAYRDYYGSRAQANLRQQDFTRNSQKQAEQAVRDQSAAFSNVGLSEYEAKLADINREYELQITLVGKGAEAAEKWAQAQKEAVEVLNANALKAANDQLREITASLSRAGMGDYARGLDEINTKYQEQIRLQGGTAESIAVINKARQAEIDLYNYNSLTKPIEDQTRSLNAQRASLEAQASALGASALEQEKAAYAQNLTNEFIQKGIQITPDLASQIDGLAQAYAKVSVEQGYLQRLNASIEAMPTTQVQRLGEYTAFLNDQMAQGNITAQQASAAYKDFTDSMDFGVVDQMADALSNLGKSAIAGFDSATDAIKQFTSTLASIMWDEYVARPIREMMRNASTNGAYGEAANGITTSAGLATGSLGSSAANPVFVSVVNYAAGVSGGEGGGDAQGAITRFVGAINQGAEDVGGAATEMAAGLIKQFEGYRDNAYWDVNHYRVGYGSDTITTAQGAVDEVTKGMATTLEDANRDLARRIADEQTQMIGQVGQRSWNELTDEAKAAVTSVAYNYGTIPKSIADAITAGGGEGLARSIEGLMGQNGGVNDARRQLEANLVREGDRLAGLGGSVASVTSSFTDLDGNLVTITKTLSGLQTNNASPAEAAAQRVALGNAVQKGTEKGVSSALSTGGGDGTQGGEITGLTPQNTMKLLGGIGALANSYFAGQQSGDPLTGAISGAVGGVSSGLGIASSLLPAAVVAGPVGWIAAGIGALLGGALGVMGANSQSNHDQEQARLAAYKSQYSDRKQFIATAGGEAYGTIESTMDQAFSKMESLASTIEAMKDPTGQLTVELNNLRSAYGKLGGRLNQEFADAFTPTLEALRSGQGLTGAFGAARQSIKDTGESLRNFVADAKQVQKAGYLGPEAVADAEAAARAYALSLLDPVDSLSKVQQRMEEIQGTANGLQQVLEDLGMSASDASDAIASKLASAIDSLRSQFVDELTAMTNDALDKGHLNDAADLMKQRAGYLNDASLLGLNPGAVDTWFSAAAQALVNNAELTGSAFADLTAQFPELAGVVTEFSAAMTRTADEIASSVTSYEDRLFAATNDNSTLYGQLLAFDRQANKDRAEETKAGGQAIVQLEAALMAERRKVLVDAMQSAFDEAVSAFSSLQSALDGAKDNLRSAISSMQDFVDGVADFRDGLKLSDDLSVLDPAAKLQESRRQYEATLAAARSGDQSAMSALTGDAQTYLTQARDYFSANSDYAEIFKAVNGQLGDAQKLGQAQIDQGKALVDLTDKADTIAQAIAKLSTAQADYDLGKAQIAQMAALGAGILDVANWTAALNGTAGSGLATIAASLATVQYGLGQINGTLTGGIAQAGAGTGVAGGQTTDMVTWLYRSVLGREPDAQGYADWWAHIRNDGTAAANIVGEFTASAQRELAMRGMRLGGLVGAYADGGIVGNGLWDVDSVIARYAGGGSIALAGGEYVMPAAQTGMYRGDLDAMRAGTWSGGAGLGNDNRPVVDAIQRGFVATHRAVVENGRLLAELVDEVRALREENAALRREARHSAGDPRLKRA